MPRRNVTTRDEVLAVAATVVAELGVAGAQPARVAQRCGISVGTLYNHFAGKDQLLAAVAELVERKFVAGMQAAAPTDHPLRQQIPALTDRLLDLSTQSPVARILLELPYYPAQSGGVLIRQWIADRVRVAQLAGEVGPADPDLVAELVFALVKAGLPHASGAARGEVHALLAAGLAALLPAVRQ